MWPWRGRTRAAPGIAVLTDVGRRRDHNEDAGAAIVAEPGGGWGFDVALIVCDGVGGSARGEVASSTTVERLRRSLSAPAAAPIAERLRSAIAEADAEIRAYAERELEGVSVGTTVVVAAIAGRTATVAHAGDSRAYVIHGREITQVTADHSMLAEQIRAGIILPTEVRGHPLQGRITRAVGLGDGMRPDIGEVALSGGDVVLLCTDGLHGLVEDREIAATVGVDLEESARRLIGLANERGGTDNSTVAMCRVR